MALMQRELLARGIDACNLAILSPKKFRKEIASDEADDSVGRIGRV